MHVVAIAVGTLLAAMVSSELSSAIHVQAGFWTWLVFGAMASGGSGLWNSTLDIVREVNKQKQELTKQLKAK